MYNVQQIIDRYNDVVNKETYNNGSTGYLSWGGKDYYLINSDKPIHINSCGGPTNFITNELGQVQVYQLTDGKSIVSYFRDEDYTIPISLEEIEDLNEWEDYFHLWDNSACSRKWWGETIDKYYPHPWYPDKEIIAIEVIRILPNVIPGHIEPVVGKNDEYKGWIELQLNGGSIDYEVDDCLAYPEFFRPIYSENDDLC